jgi:hypothetical protein
MSEISREHERDLEELAEVCSAPESGQVIGGREDPWEGEDVTLHHDFPTPHHEPPIDDL